jgi:pSer/pThr/pTyr-binding forkhead associated (FHA) protein
MKSASGEQVMSRTITAHTGVKAQEPTVGGLRLLGQQRLFSFDVPSERGTGRRKALTIGRDEVCDIWLSDPTVSGLHATITSRRARARSGDAPGPVFTLRDRGSKNGIRVSQQGPRGPFVRVSEVRLVVGLHVRIGAVTLVAVDREGACPIVATSEQDFVAQARALYGSDQATARFLGVPMARIRHLLARVYARGTRP